MDDHNEQLSPKNRGDEHPKGGVSLAPGVVIGEDHLRVVYVRSSGPGGQNVNKRSTKAQMRVEVDQIPLNDRARARLFSLARQYLNANNELMIESDETRSQSRNRKACLEKLRELVMRALIEPKIRKKTRPTRGSVRRRLEAKHQRAETKKRRKPPED
jgi:ribosome-associated protein